VFLEKWDMVKGNTQLPIFVSARIMRDVLAPIMRLNPYGIIVGKAITDSADPAEEAKFFYTACCER
jgi:3-keto-L-gulonate-6-phosphate decarboxylase